MSISDVEGSNGGKEKKLKASVAAMEVMDASTNPQILATTSTSKRYAKPAVVGFT